MEMGQVDIAMEYQKRFFESRKRIGYDRLDNFYFNLAALLVQMSKPDEAENMYRQVPGTEILTDDDLLNDDRPYCAR